MWSYVPVLSRSMPIKESLFRQRLPRGTRSAILT